VWTVIYRPQYSTSLKEVKKFTLEQAMKAQSGSRLIVKISLHRPDILTEVYVTLFMSLL
jgi:hypothetical protein